MKRNLRILMLGGAKRVSMARQLIRAGKELGVNVEIFSHELSPNEPIASVGTIIVGKKYTHPDTDADLDRLINEYHIDVILPFIDPAIAVAARCKERNPEVFIPVSRIELVNAMFDKAVAAQWFEKNGITIPQTYSEDCISYPAILKPRCGSASHGIIVANSVKDIEDADNDLNSYLIQEYIADRDEYTVDCYIGTADSSIKCIVPRIRLATAGGEVIRTETRRITTLIEQSCEILNKLKFHGPVTLQFIHDKQNDRFLLMEINPRLGGGVICSILAGADIAKMILEESEDINALPCNEWRDRTLMARYFQEVMFYQDDNNEND